MSQTLYSVGHGNRTIEELLGLLKAAGVETLVDVRARPRSRHNPQFNDDALRLACDNAGITYHWAGRQLGGLRAPRAGSPHIALDEDRRGFADHMDTDVFRQAAMQLQNLAARGACAMLCAERDPVHCHRSLIADYLVLQGRRVLHLIDPGETREHLFSSEARRESAALIYDRQATRPLDLER
ncbi:MAG: DUF488 domain-containing protein [Gammaproteobacteria bacterium]|nr:DUF488 domain-containing protein [Gammaproteobacteria bacterium]MDH3405634.1 DUF488 domain-containing protein [Gammaproteobacteria bacterium]MDH5487120.1 DUF488 domain-containing protein [Gammaproteobacteria bacterium]